MIIQHNPADWQVYKYLEVHLAEHHNQNLEKSKKVRVLSIMMRSVNTCWLSSISKKGFLSLKQHLGWDMNLLITAALDWNFSGMIRNVRHYDNYSISIVLMVVSFSSLYFVICKNTRWPISSRHRSSVNVVIVVVSVSSLYLVICTNTNQHKTLSWF